MNKTTKHVDLLDEDKPLVWLHGEVKTPPFSSEARMEAGMLSPRNSRRAGVSQPATFFTDHAPQVALLLPGVLGGDRAGAKNEGFLGLLRLLSQAQRWGLRRALSLCGKAYRLAPVPIRPQVAERAQEPWRGRYWASPRSCRAVRNWSVQA